MGLILGATAGALVLAVAGISAMRSGQPEAPTASAAPAVPAPSAPSIEEVRAAALEEGKRIATLAQKEADEKLKKAEEDAKAAEARAKTAAASAKDVDEARQARERVKVLKATVASTPKAPAASTQKPEGTPPPATPNTGTQQSGRKIRTEL
jgi:hypothetical protein